MSYKNVGAPPAGPDQNLQAVGTGRDLSTQGHAAKQGGMHVFPERKRNRMEGWDYSTSGWYFVTTCVQKRSCCLGKVSNGIMIRSAEGEIVYQQWHALTRYPYIILDAFIVMPNHVHGIIMIDRWPAKQAWTGRDPSLHPRIKSVSEIMGAFKTTSSKHIRQHDLPTFSWQRSFHDHIIRTPESLEHLREYIRTNPEHWEEDEMFVS